MQIHQLTQNRGNPQVSEMKGNVISLDGLFDYKTFTQDYYGLTKENG